MDLASLTFRTARPDEAPAVLTVLDDAAARLRARGIAQWPAAFRPEWIEPALGSGRVWLVEAGDEPVGTFALNWSDVLWADDGRAGYVHRFAVRSGWHGLGTRMLAHVDEQVLAAGRDRVRLDTGADNAKLGAYYLARGFRRVGEVPLPSEWRLWSRRDVDLLLALFEKEL